jgi:NAD(P)-dependent dehydrogenase (short-subunit alcohol dehydrogenase family)
MAMIKPFQDRVAVITGAARGIGKAIALRLAADGAHVMLNDILPSSDLERVADECSVLGGQALIMSADIAAATTARAMLDAALSRWGHVDIIVNNAFWEEQNAVGEISPEGWQKTLQVTVGGALFLIQAALPYWLEQRRGVVVNVSSVHAFASSHRRIAYDMAKNALITLTRSVACDYGPFGIRANAVCPGLIIADRNREWWTAVPERLDTVRWAYPARRPGTMEEVAAAVAFLASDEASYVNGTSLVVDGGMNAMLGEVGVLDFARDLWNERSI